MKKFSKLSIGYVVWMAVLTVIPLALMIYISFLDMSFWGFGEASFSMTHFSVVFSTTYLTATLLSLKLAFFATIGALLIGYPIAYIISNSKMKNKFTVLLLFILPMWTNLLLRVETINRLLLPNSILNEIGISLNLSGTEAAVVISMILVYLPFMIFPIYTVLEKKDKGLIEAANDLGAGPIRTFFKVTLPLSAKGIVSGVTMVFLPCAMGFTIPQIISNGNMYLIGNIIERHFKGSTGTYNIGSLTSLVLIIFVFGAMFIMSKVDKEGETLL